MGKRDEQLQIKKDGIRDVQVESRKEAVLQALSISYGVITTACQQAGISRETFYRYLKEDQEFKAKAEEMQEIALDFVESKLFDKIKAGDIIAILFYLKTKGKKRGYIEKVMLDQFGRDRLGGFDGNRTIKVGYGNNDTDKCIIKWGDNEIEV